MRSVELFTGCGGLAMGLSKAGFKAVRMVEWDRHSVSNVIHNRARGIEHVRDWPIVQEDVRAIDWRDYKSIDLVAGGPPCQPFSIGGKHKGHEDDRDMWPEAVRAVREIMPAGFIFENVRGLTRSAFADYFDWIMQSLTRPHIERQAGENRQNHLRRLQQASTRIEYKVEAHKVNAADFGAAPETPPCYHCWSSQRLGLTYANSRTNSLSRTASMGSVGERRILGQTRNRTAGIRA